jgi:hypothetical protein
VVEAELARLRAENARLLRLLKMTPEQAAPPGPGQAGLFEAPPGLVDDGSPPEVKVAFYGALFAARADVYAIRYDNPRTGTGGWVPAVLTCRHDTAVHALNSRLCRVPGPGTEKGDDGAMDQFEGRCWLDW